MELAVLKPAAAGLRIPILAPPARHRLARYNTGTCARARWRTRPLRKLRHALISAKNVAVSRRPSSYTSFTRNEGPRSGQGIGFRDPWGFFALPRWSLAGLGLEGSEATQQQTA